MPKVSVIIPIYNTAAYLREALESLRRQTLSDIEIIGVNDGSSDNSLAILQEYKLKDARFSVIDKKNSGYGHSVNCGMEAAKGEYLAIVESDDFIALTMFEDLYELAKKNELDVVKGDSYRFTCDEAKNQILTYHATSKNPAFYNRLYNPANEVETAAMYVNNCVGIYRRDFIRENKIRFNESPGASFQDNGFFWQVQIKATKALLVDKAYYYYRRDNPHSSIKDQSKVWAMKKEYDFIRAILEKEESVWQKFSSYYWLQKYRNYDFILNLIKNEDKREFAQVFKTEFSTAWEKQEFSCSVFRDSEWDRLQFLFRDLDGYLSKYCFNGLELAECRNEVQRLEKQIKVLNRKEQWNSRLLAVIDKTRRIAKSKKNRDREKKTA